MTEWFIEINGAPTGPFSEDALRGLAQEGEIPLSVSVYPAGSPNQRRTLGMLLNPTSSLPKRSGHFVPPPRPPELDPNQTLQPPSVNEGPVTIQEAEPPSEASDQTHLNVDLLDTLQMAREKNERTKDRNTLSWITSLSDRSALRDWLKPPKLYGSVALLALVGGAVALSFFLDSSSPSSVRSDAPIVDRTPRIDADPSSSAREETSRRAPPPEPRRSAPVVTRPSVPNPTPPDRARRINPSTRNDSDERNTAPTPRQRAPQIAVDDAYVDDTFSDLPDNLPPLDEPMMDGGGEDPGVISKMQQMDAELQDLPPDGDDGYDAPPPAEEPMPFEGDF